MRNAPAEAPQRSDRKRSAILEAAAEVFLRSGFLGANMDEIAARARVSKQTVYGHFSSKEALFIEVVAGMTNAASDAVHRNVPEPGERQDVEAYLRTYAYRQLEIVLTPRLMQLRRMVIGEVARFPELGRSLYEAGPGRAIEAFAKTLARMAEQGLVTIADPRTAATHFNWLIMAAPLNEAMLLGDSAIPGPPELRRYADDGVRVFLAAYGRK